MYFFRKQEEQIIVVLGQRDFREKTVIENQSKDLVQIHKVKKVFIHPFFEPPPKPFNDIALLEIKGVDIEFNDLVQPICLPHPNGNQYTDDVAVALGNLKFKVNVLINERIKHFVRKQENDKKYSNYINYRLG